VALLELAKRKKDPLKLQDSINYFRAGLQGLSSEKHPEDWLKLQSNLAAALRCWGELINDDARLRESQSLYETIARVSVGIGNSVLRSAALAAIDEIQASLTS